MFKVIFNKNQKQETTPIPNNPLWREMTVNFIKALDLMELWEEGHTNEIEQTSSEGSLSRSECVPPADAPSIPIFSKEYKPKSQTFPALQANPNIWAFTQQVTDEICQTKWKGISNSNLSFDQQEAVHSLQQNIDIVIKPSDKRGNLVVMDCAQYENMVMDLLGNWEWYKKVSEVLSRILRSSIGN